MLEVSTGEFYTGFQSKTPLLDFCIEDVLTEHSPLLHETHLLIFNLTNLVAIDSLLKNAPNFVIYRIELGTVWRS